MPFQHFIRYITTEKRFSPHTVRAYSDDLNSFHSFCIATYEHPDPVTVNSSMIRSWLAQMIDQGQSPRSVRRKLSSLNAWYKFLLRNEEIGQNPVKRIVAPKVSKRLPVFVEETAMENLFEAIRFADDFSGSRDKLMIDVLYSTGIRLSELIGIKVGDISGETVKVLGKRNKERIIPVTKSLVAQVARYLEKRSRFLTEQEESSDHLFLTDKAKKLYPGFVYSKVNYYLTQVTTITKRSPHVLRHTFATHMLNKGADLNAIKELLGHASLAATQVYTHNTIDKLKNIYKNAHPLAG